MSEAISVSVGVKPWLVPPRSSGSSMIIAHRDVGARVRGAAASEPLRDDGLLRYSNHGFSFPRLRCLALAGDSAAA